MKKAIILFLLISLSYAYTQAQSKKSIKLYLNSYFTNVWISQTHTDVISGYRSTSGSIFGLSPAIKKTHTEGTYSEFELSSFRISASQISDLETKDSTGLWDLLDGRQNYDFAASFRYEYGFNIRALLGGPTDGFSYSVGIGLQPYYTSMNESFLFTTQFRHRNINMGARFQLIPRISFGGKSKWFFDLNFPINIADAYYSVRRTDNPGQANSVRTHWQNDVRFLPLSLQARFGIGIKL